jgi:beta-fructofuranosidase
MTERRWTRRQFVGVSAASALLSSARPSNGFRDSHEDARDATLQARLAADPLRPQFHLLPAKNWMNDPNGPIYWKDHYHMFFQYNPNAAVWGDMHWNHAISDDMVHWKHLPIALAPTPGWDDADGCFTGSAVDDHGTATILYTGVKTVPPERATLRDGHANFREVQCLATSTDPQLRTWTKWNTPVIEPPQDLPITGFRDPFLWRAGDTWYLGVASGLRKVGGNVLLFRSMDLRKWEYLHSLVQGNWTGRDAVNAVDSGEMWECPDFFALGGKHVLLYSTAGKVVWETGELDPKEFVFHSERQGILDHGAYYAQKTQVDARGNRILWGWVTEKRTDDELRAAGWAGCMALPRVLSLSSDGELEMRVAPQVQSLRGKKSDLYVMDRNPQLSKPQLMNNIQIENLAAEAVWRVSPDLSGSGGLAPADFSLEDRSGSWFSLRLERPNNATPKLTVNGKSIDVSIGQKGGYEFHLFIDGSVAELICNNLYAVTTRIYRKPNGPLRLTANLDGLHVWQLRPISPNRLTT